MRGETDKIKLGALLSYVAVTVNILSGLIYSPFVIKSIGKSEYAVYVLVNSLVSLFLIDLGLGATASRFLSKYRAEGKGDRINAFLACIYKLYFAIDVVIISALTVTFFSLEYIYPTFSPSELSALKSAFAIASVFSTLNFPFSALNGVLTAYSEFIHLKLADILYRVVSLLLVFAALTLGGGVVYIVLINGVCSVLVTVYKFVTVKRKTDVKADFTYKDRETYREIISFSAWSAVASLSQRLIFNITPTILGAFCGADDIAVFGVITAVEGYVYVVTNAIHGLFLPRVSKIYAEPEPEKNLSSLMLSVGRFQYIVNGLVAAVFVSVGVEFLNLWVGDGYSSAYAGIVLVILPGLFFNSLHIATTALSVTHRVHLYALLNVFTGVINVVLSLVLSPRYGVIGACLSISAAYMFRAIMLNFICVKWLKLNMLEFSKKCYLSLTPPMLISAAVGLRLSNAFSFGWDGFIIKSVITAFVFAVCTLIFDSKVRKAFLNFVRKNGGSV